MNQRGKKEVGKVSRTCQANFCVRPLHRPLHRPFTRGEETKFHVVLNESFKDKFNEGFVYIFKRVSKSFYSLLVFRNLFDCTVIESSRLLKYTHLHTA